MRRFAMTSVLLTQLGAVLIPATASAQVVDELPLERGFYVRSDETCKTATNAGTAVLRRAGLQWVSSQCIFERIEQTAPDTYRVTQSCGDAAYSAKADAVYTIPDRTSFSFVDSAGWEHAARLCAQSAMPQPWRDLDISALID